jgi:hypothetical protein
MTKTKTSRLTLIALFCFQMIVIPQSTAVDSKTIGLFSCGAAAGLLISLYHRHWVISNADEISAGNENESFPDSILWSPLSFNQIDNDAKQDPFNQSLKQTAENDSFEYKEISRRIHLPTLMLTKHTLTNEYLVKKNLFGTKSAKKNKTTFHTAEVGTIYPYIFATTLITLGAGYACTLLNKNK